MTTIDSTDRVVENLIDRQLPAYDVVLTERLVIDADIGDVYTAARDLDFMSVRSPLLIASMYARGIPARLRGHAPVTPAKLRLARDSAVLPGWLLLGEVPGHEVAFGAVGKFWKSDIQWRDVALRDFASFHEPGWGKIACHFHVRSVSDGQTVLTYECRTATTDADSRRLMMRYWTLIRPFVGHIMRATLRTIRDQATV